MTAPVADARQEGAARAAITGEAVRDPASYRDPSGFVFRRGGVVLRQVNAVYAADWDAFTQSPLSHRLVDEGRLLPWAPVGLEERLDERACAVIRPLP